MVVMDSTDGDLREMVLDALEWDDEVGSGIGVAVSGGIVTLTGPVTGEAERTAVERAARRVRGVRAVRCELVDVAPAPLMTSRAAFADPVHQSGGW